MKIEKSITRLLLLSASSPYICVNTRITNPPTSIIAFGGTQNIYDLVRDDLNLKPYFWPKYNDENRGGFVHGGFALRTERLLEKMNYFIETNDNFILGGHSLGGSCAILAASHLTDINKSIQGIYTFGVPKLASPKFQEYYKEQGLWNKTYNFITPRDPIVKRIPYVYKDIGIFKTLDFEHDDVWEHHDLKTYCDLL